MGTLAILFLDTPCPGASQGFVAAQHPLVAEHARVGDALVVVGTPFGALSPYHFRGLVACGTIANQVLAPGLTLPSYM